MNLDAIREQIPATKNAVYLNSGWSGPSPRSVVEAIKTPLDYESEEGPTTRPVFESGKAIQAHAKESVASLLNVTPEEILMTQCTTDGLNVVLNGLPWEEGDEVITTPMTFCATSNAALYQGAEVKFVDINKNTLNLY